MQLVDWVMLCIVAGLAGAFLRRRDLSETLLCGILAACLLLFVAIKNGWASINPYAVSIATFAALLLGYASYGLYKQNKEELHYGAMMTPYTEREYPESLEEHEAHCEICQAMGYGPQTVEGSSCAEQRMKHHGHGSDDTEE